MRKIMLNGRWELAEAGKDTLCAVQVPGSVLSGLYGAGKIEDPFCVTVKINPLLCRGREDL